LQRGDFTEGLKWTSGPSATVRQILELPFERPRNRANIADGHPFGKASILAVSHHRYVENERSIEIPIAVPGGI
jgi:hypothetical protein